MTGPGWPAYDAAREEIGRVLEARGKAVVSGDRQLAAARALIDAGRATFVSGDLDHGGAAVIARAEQRTDPL